MKCASLFVVAISAAALLLASAACVGATPGATTSRPRPSVDRGIMAAAKEWFYRFQSGHIDRSQLNDLVNRELTPVMIRQEAATLMAYGHPSSFVFLRSNTVEYAQGYEFLLTFRSAKILEAIAFELDGKIAGIDFQILLPAQKVSNVRHPGCKAAGRDRATDHV